MYISHLNPCLVAQIGTVGQRKALAKQANLSLDMMKTLVKDEDWRVRKALAKRFDLPLDLMDILAIDKDWQVRKALAKRFDLIPNLMEALAKDEDWRVRKAVAERPVLAAGLIEVLIKDENKLVRRAMAARNDLTEEHTIALLQQDDPDIAKVFCLNFHLSDECRIGLAKTPHLPDECKTLLFKDESDSVLVELSKRNDLTEEQLRKLAFESPNTHEHILKNPQTLNVTTQLIIAFDISRENKLTLLNRSDVCEEVLVHFTYDIDDKVRSEVALHKALPQEQLERFVQDEKDIGVLENLAQREDLTPKAIDILTEHGRAYDDIGNALLSNESIPYERIQEISNKIHLEIPDWVEEKQWVKEQQELERECALEREREGEGESEI